MGIKIFSEFGVKIKIAKLFSKIKNDNKNKENGINIYPPPLALYSAMASSYFFLAAAAASSHF